MIIEFSVANYCSFDEIQTISFRATGLKSADTDVDDRNTVLNENGGLLKVIGLYGANASGKSNFIKALAFFRDMVINSVSVEGYANYGVNPFRQVENSVVKPSYFQIILLLDKIKYRYGFTINYMGEVESEWLFGPADKNETYYFKRTNNDVSINNEWFEEGLSLPQDNLRADALFLTFCSTYNGSLSRKIRIFLNRNTAIEARIPRRPRRPIIDVSYMSTNKLVEEGNADLVLTWLKEVGLNYSDIKIKREIDRFPGSTTYLFKNVFDDSGNIVGQTAMDLIADESEGTRKFYNYIGKLFFKFKTGGLYVCDEIDNNFHPSLLQKIIKLFQNSNINTANAQLLFTSHDTNLMDPDIMRRDQFYFTEKSANDSTKIYSLADLKGVRNNADFARQYLAGLYGALPILSDLLEKVENSDFDNDSKI